MRWEQKFRPERFDQVRGQDHAVRLLSALSVQRTSGRNLLLHGAVGSGKTSLAKLFSRALNCIDIEPDGSPCGRCDNCLDPRRYHFEYDVPGRSDDNALSWAKEIVRSHSEGRVRVLFFDEAHALSKVTQNGFLKLIEDDQSGTCFFFATTEVRKLIPAFVSRLTEIRIHALTPAVAYELLEHIAKQENIAYEPEALHLLVAAKPPFARDLTIALQRLHDDGGRIDADLVKRVYDLSVRDHLGDYCIALARGDRHAQVTTSIRQWPASLAEKVRWIRSFLATVYYNDVLGQLLPLDPLVQSMVSARREFVTQLCARFDLADCAEAEPFLKRMLEFWSQPVPQDDETAGLKLMLFEGLISTGLLRPGVVQRDEDLPNIAPTRSDASGSVASQKSSVLTSSPYIEREEIRQIINRSSFFVQHYGVLLNVALRLHIRSGDDLECVGAKAISDLCNELDAWAGLDSRNFASIAVLERDGARSLVESSRISIRIRSVNWRRSARTGLNAAVSALRYRKVATKNKCSFIRETCKNSALDSFP
ncbi:AAA family ATPase [Bradyrhizobium sp. AUGA SZCCT0274]|uniref:AAA family ATPase n=1 Tax=Bradyrhizobium sp. AUGA SZCCT0274 TaxID=2807670 RepID=UPI001BA7DB62|nr:AAA family ATPase [Bradyrhizobium sp. AUGA SZCCT0274]MBR1240263.1 AAA family ATPase [Bradyrhizobium sp. AUGA SZCCT0274]